MHGIFRGQSAHCSQWSVARFYGYSLVQPVRLAPWSKLILYLPSTTTTQEGCIPGTTVNPTVAPTQTLTLQSDPVPVENKAILPTPLAPGPATIHDPATLPPPASCRTNIIAYSTSTISHWNLWTTNRTSVTAMNLQSLYSDVIIMPAYITAMQTEIAKLLDNAKLEVKE